MLVVGTGVTLAQPSTDAQPPRAQVQSSANEYTCHTDIELPLLALSLNALAVQAERPVSARASVLAAIALRDGADGDFQSTTLALGSEFRLWLRSDHRRWFAAPRIEFGFTRVSALNPSRSLGNAVIGTAGIVLGYRFLLWRHLTIVPEIGVAGRADLVSRVPDRKTFTPLFGIALGWRLQ
jgi:hypothetical protein